MKLVVHRLYRRDDDIGRQAAGQGSPKGIGWMVKVGSKTGDLTKGMDTRIGSACAHHVDILPDNSGHSLL